MSSSLRSMEVRREIVHPPVGWLDPVAMERGLLAVGDDLAAR